MYTLAIASFFITSCTSSTETDHGHAHDENGEHMEHDDHGDHPHNGDEHHDHHQDEFKVDADSLK